MRDGIQQYVQGLGRIIENNHHYLKESIDDFQEKCRMVALERNIPPDIVVNIRAAYKEIRSKLTETEAIQQILRGKCRKYYRRDPLRDKKMMEFGFITKNCYYKFECILMQLETKKRIKKNGGDLSTRSGKPNDPMVSVQGESGCEVSLKRDVEEEMEPTKIVIQYNDGRVIKGFTRDFSLHEDCFHLYSAEKPSAKAVKVLMKELKTVFIVQDFNGNSQYIEMKKYFGGEEHSGQQVEAAFAEDEMLVGSALSRGTLIHPPREHLNSPL